MLFGFESGVPYTVAVFVSWPHVACGFVATVMLIETVVFPVIVPIGHVSTDPSVLQLPPELIVLETYVVPAGSASVTVTLFTNVGLFSAVTAME